MTEKTYSGSCLCGAVRYQFSGSSKLFQYCHCSRCRKVGGSAHSANIIIRPTNFKWLQGEELLGRYELPDAKDFATGFCKVCGSTLPWQNKSGRAVIIPAGSLDDDPQIKPTQNIYYRDRAVWYVEAAGLPKHDQLPDKK